MAAIVWVIVGALIVGAAVAADPVLVQAEVRGIPTDHTGAVIAGVFSLLNLIVTGGMAWLIARSGAQAKKAAADADTKVEAVKTTLEASTASTTDQLNGLGKVAKDTHTLVNSNMGVQLRLNAAMSKRLFKLTRTKDDKEAASLAQAMYDEHVKKQAAVDSNK